MLTVRNLILLLDYYFPLELPAQEALYVLLLLLTLFPLYSLHNLQRQDGSRQPMETAWKKSFHIVMEWFTNEINNTFPDLLQVTLPNSYILGIFPDLLQVTLSNSYILGICDNLDWIYEYLGSPDGESQLPFKIPPPILITTYKHCIMCPAGKVLRRSTPPRNIKILGHDNTLQKTQLVVAECSEKQCKAVYYPDRITFKSNSGRRQRLLCNAQYLRLSKTGLWAHRNVAYMQENCVNRFHCGWSSFADFYNDTFGAKSITIWQSQ